MTSASISANIGEAWAKDRHSIDLRLWRLALQH